MTNRELYDAALRACGELGLQGLNTDYEERASYLLPIVCARMAHLDRLYREANALADQTLPASLMYALTANFPLSEVFAPSAACLLGSLLSLEEDAALSARLEKDSEKLLEVIRASIPAQPEPILDCYAHLK